MREQIALAARTSSNVLVTGESGVGKEPGRPRRARGRRAPRRRLRSRQLWRDPRDPARSQLFGHLRGAFTTAVHANPGLFVTASHGTLFLDEIGEMPLQLQVKLLRVIEDKSVLPVGGTKPVPVDARIIASTNRDLEREVEAGRFREDLFYRLNVVHLTVPPLRERRGDIPVLVDHLVERLNAKLDMRCLGVERDALWSLVGRPWKGATSASSRTSPSGPWSSAGSDLISMRDLSSDLGAAAGTPPQDLRGAVRRSRAPAPDGRARGDSVRQAQGGPPAGDQLWRPLPQASRGEGDETVPAASKSQRADDALR